MNELVGKLGEIVGCEHLADDPETVGQYNRGTMPVPGENVMIVRPQDANSLSACIQIAQRLKIPFHVSSVGRNWGYGSRLPSSGSCIHFDMCRMKKISAVDTESALATVEAGVTFRELNSLLHENATGLFLNPPSSGAKASIIGNLSQGGLLRSETVERNRAVTNLEVVLPNGEICKLGGTGKLRGTENVRASRKENTFNMTNHAGIITKASVHLDRYPPFWQHFECLVKESEVAVELDGVRGLMRNETLTIPPIYYNDLRILSSCVRSPLAGAANKRCLSSGEISKLKKELGVAGGMLSGVIKASNVEHLVELKKNVLAVLGDAQFDAINHAGSFYGFWDDDGGATNSAYWQVPAERPCSGNPDFDQCGLVWVSPRISFTRSDVSECTKLMRSTFASFGFDFPYTVRVLNTRALCIIASLHYDRSELHEDARARECFLAVSKKFEMRGWSLHRRPPISCAELLLDDCSRKLSNTKLKQTFAPQRSFFPTSGGP